MSYPLEHPLLHFPRHWLHPQPLSHIHHFLSPLIRLPQRLAIPVTPNVPITFIHPLLQLFRLPFIPQSCMTVIQHTALHTRLHHPGLPPLGQQRPFQQTFLPRPYRGRLGVTFIHLFVYVCWSCETVFLMLCYNSIAPSTCKDDISASAVCHL